MSDTAAHRAVEALEPDPTWGMFFADLTRYVAIRWGRPLVRAVQAHLRRAASGPGAVRESGASLAARVRAGAALTSEPPSPAPSVEEVTVVARSRSARGWVHRCLVGWREVSPERVVTVVAVVASALLAIFVFTALSDLFTACVVILVFTPVVVFSVRCIARALGVLHDPDEDLRWLHGHPGDPAGPSISGQDHRPEPDFQWLHEEHYVPKRSTLSRRFPKHRQKIKRRT